jgi:hypothetical protein
MSTVMRPAASRELVTDAGLAQVDVLLIGHPFWRFYRLH